MHSYTLEKWQHNHRFGLHDQHNERSTLRVVMLTVIMMTLEISAGAAFGSMALLADGWHMGTHAAALGITLFAYIYARRHADDPRYSFGVGKIGVLAGFSSAIVLLVIALLMAGESFQRLLAPQPIQFNEAIFVAVIGLAVNLFSAFLLQRDPAHDHDHHHHHDDEEDHEHAEDGQQDHNLKAAYLHVLADALTSVLAIAALLAGKSFGWTWLDAAMGIVGALVITRWSVGLLGDTSQILLDRTGNPALVARIKSTLEAEADNRVCDLHIWKVSSTQFAAIVSLVTHFPRPIEHYRFLLKDFPMLIHITLEIYHCEGEPCIPLAQAGEKHNACRI